MNKFDKIWTKLELYLVGIFSLIAIFVGFYGVVMRYVFTEPVGWTEEVIMYVMVWALLIILSPVQRDNEHIRLDLLYNRYPKKIKPIVDILIILMSLAFSAVVIIYGFSIVENYINANQLSQSSLQMPLWIVRLSIPVGFLLLSGRMIQSLIGVIRELKIIYSSNNTT